MDSLIQTRCWKAIVLGNKIHCYLKILITLFQNKVCPTISIDEKISGDSCKECWDFFFLMYANMYSPFVLSSPQDNLFPLQIKCKNVIVLAATNVDELDMEWNCLLDTHESGLVRAKPFVSKHLSTSLPDVCIFIIVKSIFQIYFLWELHMTSYKTCVSLSHFDP